MTAGALSGPVAEINFQLVLEAMDSAADRHLRGLVRAQRVDSAGEEARGTQGRVPVGGRLVEHRPG
ncbi:MAG TPA: hypothetical protein VKD88_09755 [Gaiellaceae bacterium]|nr:hypothetical protein [Gaiellaceae bacterium]